MSNNHVFRLCHVCKNLNESAEEILRCGYCQKGFLPMHYFEKMRGQIKKALEIAGPAADIEIPTNPLPGLLVFW